MKQIFESRDAAERRVQGIIEVSNALRAIDDTKLYEAVEKAAIFNEDGDLGEILNQALETVKEEHPELVSNPNADETAAVASANTDQELFYGEYKLKLNLASLSDGYIEIVVSKNGIETVKAEDKPKPAEEEKSEEQPATADTEENKTPEGDQIANTPAEGEKKESMLSDKQMIAEGRKSKKIVESYDDKVDMLWTKIEDFIDNLNNRGVALITHDEVVFVDEDILNASFAGDQYLEDTVNNEYALDLLDVVSVMPVNNRANVEDIQAKFRRHAVYLYGLTDDNTYEFVESNYKEVIDTFK